MDEDELLNTQCPQHLELRWQTEVSSSVYATPLIADTNRLRLFIHMPNNITQEMLITQVQQLKLADKVPAEGFLVVVLDFFYGEPFDLNNPNMDWESWRKAHGVEKGFEDAKPVISALQSKGVTSIGWVVVVKLARTDEIQAAVVLHPGRITEDEIKAFVEKMQTSGDLNLIGQFGVGFYSLYLSLTMLNSSANIMKINSIHLGMKSRYDEKMSDFVF
ncbi:unnamed protein product [Camellia sinensis]